MLDVSINSAMSCSVKSVIEYRLNPEQMQNNFDDQPIIEGEESEDADSLFNDS